MSAYWNNCCWERWKLTLEAAPATDTAETAMDKGSIAAGCALLNHTGGDAQNVATHDSTTYEKQKREMEGKRVVSA